MTRTVVELTAYKKRPIKRPQPRATSRDINADTLRLTFNKPAATRSLTKNFAEF